jgi:hypothetical protein
MEIAVLSDVYSNIHGLEAGWDIDELITMLLKQGGLCEAMDFQSSLPVN